jgi:PAS domain-containing protein
MPLDLIQKWMNLVNLIAKVIPGVIVWINGRDNFYISQSQFSLEEVTIKWGDLCETITKSGKNFFLSEPKPGVKSFLGFPILWPDKDIYGSLCIIDLKKEIISELNTQILQDFADQFNLDLALVYHQNQLKTQVGERRKELNLLYFLTEISFIPNLSVEDILEEAVHQIPNGWQYPEFACARIDLDGRVYQSENFKETPWVQIADILTNGKKNGMVAVYYLKEMPKADEGPFLKEERDLINGIVRLLNFTIKEKQSNEILYKEKVLLDSIISSSPGLYFVLDSSNRFSKWNRRLQEVTGYTPKDLRGTTFQDIVLEEDKHHFAELESGYGRILDIQTQQFLTFYFYFQACVINEKSYIIASGFQKNNGDMR